MRRRMRHIFSSRKRLWRQVSGTLERMRLSRHGACSTNQGRQAIRSCMRRIRQGDLQVGDALSLISGAALLAYMLFSGEGLGIPVTLLAVSSVSGMMVRRDDPLFPSEGVLMQAGLLLKSDGELGIPNYAGVKVGRGPATHLLKGERYGRTVISGIQTTAEGDVLVSTGISSGPPSYCCQVIEGRLSTSNSPMEVNSALMSMRTGPGRLVIVNDGRWLVIQRLLPFSDGSESAWLMLRQLRDISLAEILAGDDRS